MLLEAGGLVKLTDNSGKSALDYARIKKRHFIKELLQVGRCLHVAHARATLGSHVSCLPVSAMPGVLPDLLVVSVLPKVR